MIQRYSIHLSPFAFIVLIAIPFAAPADIKEYIIIGSLGALYLFNQICIKYFED